MQSKFTESIFTYSVTRPFPYKWFTWVVLLGGTVLAVLFSFVAVASNGYTLQPIYTTDPNGTEAQQHWFEKKPFSWYHSLDAKCQSSLLTVGGSYKTSNRGFVYTLSGLQNGSRALPTVAYKNAALRGCEIDNVHITLARLDNSRLAMNYWTWGATTAAVSCLNVSSSINGNLTLRQGLDTLHNGLHDRTSALELHGDSSRRRFLRYPSGIFWSRDYNGLDQQFRIPEGQRNREHVVRDATYRRLVWEAQHRCVLYHVDLSMLASK